ncbi:DUF1844 domain-containing protein [Terriglobus sp.]|uniref:DUF1844 domain-containing protein n=1 Tax=Terriglobus sp. TaxID=1889013 RepID=UPI003AFF626D
MAEQDKPFVINDRRKFRTDGELREPAPERAAETTGQPASNFSGVEQAEGGKVVSIANAAAQHEHVDRPRGTDRSAEPIPFQSHMVTPEPVTGENAAGALDDEDLTEVGDENLPPPPTAEEVEQVKRAYDSTAERLETVMRASNPGGEHLPPMDFSRLVQSVYMSAMVQMGAGTPQGEQARVDLMGAKQSIDMLGTIAEKSAGNLDSREQLLIDSALFELRMGFLEITQLLARQAASRQQGTPGAPGFGGPGAPGGGGPRIVS